jgi:hypothetical protein
MITEWNFAERDVFYEDKENGIRFVSDLKSGMSAYDVVIPVFANPERSTDEVMKRLTVMSPHVPYILERYGVSPEDLHIALLKVRIKEMNRQYTELIRSTVID